MSNKLRYAVYHRDHNPTLVPVKSGRRGMGRFINLLVKNDNVRYNYREAKRIQTQLESFPCYCDECKEIN